MNSLPVLSQISTSPRSLIKDSLFSYGIVIIFCFFIVCVLVLVSVHLGLGGVVASDGLVQRLYFIEMHYWGLPLFLGRALGCRVHLRLGSVACWLGIQAIGASHKFLGVTSVALWIGCAIGASLIGHNCHQEHRATTKIHVLVPVSPIPFLCFYLTLGHVVSQFLPVFPVKWSSIGPLKKCPKVLGKLNVPFWVLFSNYRNCDLRGILSVWCIVNLEMEQWAQSEVIYLTILTHYFGFCDPHGCLSLISKF